MDTLRAAIKARTITIALDYARLSKDKKKLSENVGIQSRENKAFIEDQEWQYGGSFSDNDISASKFGTKTRDDYWRMVEAIKTWPGQPGVNIQLVIVVTEMPRLYRQLEELLDLIKLAEPEQGKTEPRTKLRGIWTTDGEGYDLSTPEGYHRAVGAVNNAVLESKRASKRQLRKKKNQAAQGKYMGGQRLYGFEGAIKDKHGNVTNRERVNVEEVPEEIKHWWEWYHQVLAGEKQSSIIKENNARGIPTPGGSVGKWQVGNFKAMMIKDAYVIFDPTGHPEDCPCLENQPDGGTLVHTSSGTKHRAQHRGLITPEEHEVLLACFELQAQKWQHGPVKGRAYMFSGLLRCGGTYQGKPCLSPMYGNGRDMGSTYQRRYRCKPFNNAMERTGCGKVFRDAEAVDAWVCEQVIQRLTTEEVTSALIPEEDSARAGELTKELTVLRRRAELIKRQYARGEIEELSEYKVMKAEIEEAIEEKQAGLRKIQTTKAGRMLPADGNIRDAFERGTLQWKRSFIELVVDHIVVHPGHPGSKMWNGKRFKGDLIEIVWRELSTFSGVITVLRAALGR